MILTRDRYLVYVCQKVGGIYSVRRKWKFQRPRESLTYKKKAFVIDYTKILYRRGRQHVLVFDLDSGKQLTGILPDEIVPTPSPASVFRVIKQRTASAILSDMTAGMGGRWVVILIVAIVGVGFGIMLGQYIDLTGSSGGVIP